MSELTPNRGYLLPIIDAATQKDAVKDYNISMLKVDLDVSSIMDSISKIHMGLDIFDAHAKEQNNPHKVSKEQVGLGNANNTADMEKPISKAVQAALDALPVITVGADVPDDAVGKDGDVFFLVDP